MRSAPLIASLALAFMAMGCAPRQAMSPSPAAPAQASAPESASGAPTGVRRSYVVKKGDSLWAIAARKSVYGDAFLWPLLYRQNRDQVSDPDLIYVRQDLNYLRHPKADERRAAREKALATPAFKPHSGPRKELPIAADKK
jgi:nucleoid-associated protein YgaU